MLNYTEGQLCQHVAVHTCDGFVGEVAESLGVNTALVAASKVVLHILHGVHLHLVCLSQHHTIQLHLKESAEGL